VVAGRAGGILPGDQFILMHDEAARDLTAVTHRIATGGDTLMYAGPAAGRGGGRSRGHGGEHGQCDKERLPGSTP